MTPLFIRTERLGPEDGGMVHLYSPVTKLASQGSISTIQWGQTWDPDVRWGLLATYPTPTSHWMNTLISIAILGQLDLNKYHHPTPPWPPPHPYPHTRFTPRGTNTGPSAALAGASVAGWRHLVVGLSIPPKTLCSSVLRDGIFQKEVSPRQADSERFWGLQPSPQSSHFWRGGTQSRRMTHTQSQLHSLDFQCRFHYNRSASKCGGSLTIADYGPSMVMTRVLSPKLCRPP